MSTHLVQYVSAQDTFFLVQYMINTLFSTVYEYTGHCLVQYMTNTLFRTVHDQHTV